MKRLLTLLVLAALVCMVALSAPSITQAQSPHSHNVCGDAQAGSARCLAIQMDKQVTSSLSPFAASPGGLNPADLQNAYKLSSSGGSGQTIAIVDAFDDPNAESDLAVYRAQFGLSPCTTANGCFRKVNQNGGTSYPTPDAGWAEEISLDLDMASAICPNCKILLVEASSASFTNLGTAVNRAVTMGATVVSNSYGGSESSGETSFASFYNHPGVIITASSGDNGYGVEVPAAYNTVVAVGGTTLTKTSNSRGWSETVWSGAGSGCSRYITKPSWQQDSGCSRRTVADVAAVADPNTGVSVYDTYGGVGGWLVFGGTSVSAPIIASIYALAGNASGINAASSLYSAPAGSLFDVTSGSNGHCGNKTYLCTGTSGYDGPTGLGTPNGTTAF
ncbi:MAG: S53 family peptidase [Ktedonobacteraceae bacterium]|nr:S53 family peptidase [Ktedonobacteraceae bacterium]